MYNREAEAYATPLIRVAVCDGNAHMLAGLTSLLAHQAEFEVVGVATNGAEAVQLVERDRPDVIVLEVHMPVMNAFAALPRIQAVAPATATILYTADAVHHLREWGLRAGAGAVLDKLGPLDELVATIRLLGARSRRMRPTVSPASHEPLASGPEPDDPDRPRWTSGRTPPGS